MLLRAGSVAMHEQTGSTRRLEARLAAAGGLSRLGVNLVTLRPGDVSAERHWHAESDEFLFVLEGIAVVVDDDGAEELTTGDCVCWPAGVPNAHRVENRSGNVVRYLVVGSRPPRDQVRYPDSGCTLYHDPPVWRVVADDGTVLREGRC